MATSIREIITAFLQCCGSGYFLDPDLEKAWVRVRYFRSVGFSPNLSFDGVFKTPSFEGGGGGESTPPPFLFVKIKASCCGFVPNIQNIFKIPENS